MFFFSSYFYYIIIGLQAICAIHALRRGKQNWLWLIIFLPAVGCLIYIFTEMFTGREIEKVQSGLSTVINPNGRIKKLEDNLRFTDTFNNRIMLADAYLEAGFTDKAIALYEQSLTGAFSENEHVIKQMIIAYYQKERYNDLLPLVKKIYKQPQFARSRAHMLYAMALEKTGQPELAEKEFLTMKGRYAHYEFRYQYGLFLVRAQREQEARKLFADMVEEAPHLSSRERRYNRTWINLAGEELKKI